MVDSQDFLVTREVALRTGEIQYKYRTADGRFIVDARTLSRIRFTSDEIINGLHGIEKITHEEAETLIAKNNYQMGDDVEAETVGVTKIDAPVAEEVEEVEETSSSSSEEEEVVDGAQSSSSEEEEQTIEEEVTESSSEEETEE